MAVFDREAATVWRNAGYVHRCYSVLNRLIVLLPSKPTSSRSVLALGNPRRITRASNARRLPTPSVVDIRFSHRHDRVVSFSYLNVRKVTLSSSPLNSASILEDGNVRYYDTGFSKMATNCVAKGHVERFHLLCSLFLHRWIYTVENQADRVSTGRVFFEEGGWLRPPR